MTLTGRDADRMRWRCRRGMLELDLVLNAFMARHLDGLEGAQLAAVTRLLDRIDPELLDLVMGREEAVDADERAVLALMRAESCSAAGSLTPDPSPERGGEIRVVNG